MNITEDIHQPTRKLNRVFSSLSLCLIIYASFFSWQSWRVEKSDQINNFHNIMELGEKAVDTFFTQLENSMLGLSQDIIAKDGPIDLDHAFNLVKRFKESHPELINITFIREDGQILFTAKAPPGPKLPTLALEPSFLKYRNELQEGHPLGIGQPLISLMGKEWIIPLRFVVHDKEGKIVYFISANLPVEILQKYWKDAPFTKTAALGLMRDDGFLVSRYPVPEKIEMAKVYGIPRTGALINYLRQKKFPANGYVEGPSSLEGPNYLNAFRRLEHFPITLFIAIPVSEILAGWWDKVKVPYILTVVLLIGGFLISQWMLRLEHTREKERRHASEILSESETRFRKLFELNSAIKLMIDPDNGNIIEANKAAADYYGWPIKQLKQMQFQEINTLSPEDVRNEIEKAISSESLRHEFQHRKADGSIRDVEVFNSKIEISGKTFLYSIIHDISDRKHTEKALLDSRWRMKSIIEGTHVGTWEWNVQTGETVFNETWAEIIGYTLDELSPISIKTWEALVHPDDQKHSGELLEQHFMGELPYYDCECRMKHKNGHWVWVHDCGRVITRTFDDKPLMMFGTHTDITERKQMETELLATRDDLENKVLERTKELDYVNAALMAEINEREKIQTILSESELRYRTLFLRSCIGILVLSLSRKITEVNELFASMHGFSIPEMLSMRLKDFVTPETHRLAYEVSGRIMAGEILTAEVEHYHKDGHVLALEVTVSIISSDGGDSAVLCLYRDITEHKQAERDRIAREVAEEANLIKSLFVANMSHEIRTPMNAILGFAQVLERDPLLTSAQAEHVRIITHSGAHLMRLIGDILDISKIESGRITLAEATFSLHDLLSDMETMFRFRVNAKGLQLVMERDANTPRYVTGDESRLRQVLVNLMGNAFKFTVTGWIAVRVRSDVVAGKTGGDAKALRLVVEVEDTGPGIPDEEMGWIFGSFQQGGYGVKAGGTGLGLAISRRLVEMMRGELTVTSQVGKGSCFRFEVLLKLAAEVAEQDKLLSRRIVLEPAYIIPEATVALPKELIHAMLQAVEEGDMDRMTKLVAQLEKIDSATARGLQVLTDRFDYEELGRWLKKGVPSNE
ncbi:MAG: PAS domain S-box protein [Deltaproteobacteria bacterium]